MGAVACGQSGEAVTPCKSTLERDGQGHGGQRDLGRRRGQRVDGDEAEDDGGESPRAEPPDEGDGGAVEAGAGRARADRDHPHDGQCEDREDHVTPVGVLEARHEHDGAEGEPDQQGEQRPGLLGEPERSCRGDGRCVPKAMPPTKAATNPFVPATHGRRIGEECQGQDGQGADPGCAPSVPPGPGQQSSAPATPIPTPSAAPPSSSTTALVRWVPLTASAVTAPAMKTLTNGVAMPSFRPLSTLSTRRTPAGTRSSCMIEAPSAASVGATMAPMAAATQSPRRGTASGHGDAGARWSGAVRCRAGGPGSRRRPAARGRSPERRRRRARWPASLRRASGSSTSAG